MPYDNIPAELKVLRQWCCWRYEQRPKAEKPTKPCYNPLTNNYASVTDPATWVDFATAVSHAHRYDGIGFVFTRADPYAGIDLDATQDPNLWASHNTIYSNIVSYSERSPSGEGAHIIVRAKLSGPGRRRHKVELYDCERYLTFTGDIIDSRVTIIDAQPLIDQLYLELGGSDNGGTANQESERETSSDSDILTRARNAKNGERFSALFEGAWSTAVGDSGGVQYPSQSEADQALVNIIAFYTQNHEQIIRIFRSSALGQRDKARRGDYCARLVRKALDRTTPTETIERLKMCTAPHLAAVNEKLASAPPEVVIRPAVEVESRPVRWLWKGWLAKGKFHLLGGAPGAGKTTLTLALAAALSRGAPWPDGSRPPVGNVLFWTGEDEIEDTINPRLEAMGADMSRIAYIESARGQDGKLRPFNPATDIDALSRAIDRMQTRPDLIIIDPIVAMVGGKANSHNNAETRVALQPIVDFSNRFDCASIGITHFTKGTSGHDPVERMTGSLAFGALARVAMAAIVNKRAEEEGEPPRLFIRAKGNNGPDGGGFGYAIKVAHLSPQIETTRIEWLEALDGSAKEIMDEAEREDDKDGKETKVEVAKTFLATALGAFERPAKDIIEEAKLQGISKRALDRASQDMVDKRKDGNSGAWYWTWKAAPRNGRR